MATHSQSGSVGHHMVRFLKEDDAVRKCGAPGACLAMLKGLITLDGVSSTFASNGTTPEDFRNIPYLAFRGWYPGLADQVYKSNVAAIKAVGGTAEFIALDDPVFGTRFQGVTHKGTANLGG